MGERLHYPMHNEVYVQDIPIDEYPTRDKLLEMAQYVLDKGGVTTWTNLRDRYSHIELITFKFCTFTSCSRSMQSDWVKVKKFNLQELYTEEIYESDKTVLLKRLEKYK